MWRTYWPNIVGRFVRIQIQTCLVDKINAQNSPQLILDLKFIVFLFQFINCSSCTQHVSIFYLPIKICEIVQLTVFSLPNFAFQCISHYVETPGKFKNVKIIFELNYTGVVMVIARREWGSPLQNPRFPDSILTMFCIFTSLYILQVQIYWSFPAIFYR